LRAVLLLAVTVLPYAASAEGDAQPFRVGFSSSPKIIPTLICFRADYAPAFKDKILAGLRDLHLSPAGQQVLTVFRCEKLEEIPADGLQSTLNLLGHFEKLREGVRVDPINRMATQTSPMV
jgi:hypothetical protein